MAAVISVIVKWGGKEYPISELSDTDTVSELKHAIHKHTGVLPARQKLLGLKYKGKVPADDMKLVDLKLKPNCKIMMMGTTEENIASVVDAPLDVGTVVDDFDVDEEEVRIENRDEYLAKIKRRVDTYEIKELNPPRQDKKLLVLDIDYTLFDHKSCAERAEELMRPHLHEFLTETYQLYNIVIWSATSMKWIEVKMKELGVASHQCYKIWFYLDSTAMISVHTPKYGVIETKPLGVIWGKYSEYSAENTVMIDDVRRNFLMNPQSGLRIRAFREAHLNRRTDDELRLIKQYLLHIAQYTDFTHLNHKHWDRYKTG